MQRPRGCRARGAFPELQEERKEARKVGRHSKAWPPVGVGSIRFDSQSSEKPRGGFQLGEKGIEVHVKNCGGEGQV